MATQGCPWELEKWQISSLGINVFDVHLYFDSSGSIQYKPYIKPTSLGIPWSCSSAHNAPIHLAWPKAALKRYYALSSTIESYHEARDVLIQRLRSFGASRGLLRALTEFDPGAKLVTKKSNKEKSIWWPLPWHPAWASAQFDRRIAAWRCRPEIDVLFRDAGIGDCAIRVAWSLAGSRLLSLVRKKTTCGKHMMMKLYGWQVRAGGGCCFLFIEHIERECSFSHSLCSTCSQTNHAAEF